MFNKGQLVIYKGGNDAKDSELTVGERYMVVATFPQSKCIWVNGGHLHTPESFFRAAPETPQQDSLNTIKQKGVNR